MLTGKKSEDKEIAEYQQKVFLNEEEIDEEVLQEYENDDNLEFD